MMKLADKDYVCISDLHLGARYSILSARGHSAPGSDTASYQSREQAPSLQALAASLRRYIPEVFGDDEPPTLIILGDLVDFSFGTTEDIVHAFKQFIALIFDTNKTPLFDSNIVFIPGNHDHHLWQSCKDELFARNFESLGDGDYQDQHVHNQVTPLYQPHPLPSAFLNTIARSVNSAVSVKVCYPNLGLSTADGAREVYLHHGHFVEPAYRLITTFNTLMADIDSPSIDDLEKQNGGWIDFFWSSLGASRVQRDTAIRLFDVMQNPAASQDYARRLAESLGDYLSEHHSVSPHTPVYKHLTVEKLFKGIIDGTLARFFQLERASFHRALSREAVTGLEWYLSKPLLQQIRQDRTRANITHQEHDGELELDASFIFGHTHKPFEDQLVVEGFRLPVNIINSGGWVVDKPGFTSMQGGSIVFIDKTLNVASLRLFHDPVNGEMCPVTAEGRESELLQKMRNSLEAHSGDWATFQEQVRIAIDQRAEEARSQFFDPHSRTGMK